MISPKLYASTLALELLRAAVHAAAVTVALATCTVEGPRAGAADAAAASDECDLSRKVDIMRSPRWQQAIAELREWLDTQTIHPPAEVRRIKVRFNERVAAMSSYEIEYLLDSIAQKMELLGTPQARDAKAWLGEYLAAMSDARRAHELRAVPNLLDMNAAELQQEIQRIDRKRGALQQRQQGVAARQNALVDRAAANRQSSADAARATAERLRAAPAQAPTRQGGGKPPFSDVPQRSMSIGVGPMGAFISM